MLKSELSWLWRTGGFAGVWLRRPGRRLRMERLGGILQKTATACCWFRRRLSTGGARASSPERPRALLAIQEVANKSVLWSWVACACRSCGIRSPTTTCMIRRTHEHGRALVLVVRMPLQGAQHADALTARLAGMLIGALLRDVLAREAWTRFPARCFGSPASCLGSPSADTLRAVQRS